MTGPTPSSESLANVTRSLGDVTEHPAENRNGVNRRIVGFIVIYRLYLRRPGPRHRTVVAAMQHTGLLQRPARISSTMASVPSPPVPFDNPSKRAEYRRDDTKRQGCLSADAGAPFHLRALDRWKPRTRSLRRAGAAVSSAAGH